MLSLFFGARSSQRTGSCVLAPAVRLARVIAVCDAESGCLYAADNSSVKDYCLLYKINFAQLNAARNELA